MRRQLMLLVIAGLLPMAAESQPPNGTGLPIGCWALRDSTDNTAHGSLYWAPAITQLKNSRDTSRWGNAYPGALDASRMDSTGKDLSPRDDPRNRGWGFWFVDASTDSLRIGFSSGFSGTWFALAPPRGALSDTLYGRAFEHWDYKPITERGRASAVRVSCPTAKIP